MLYSDTIYVSASRCILLHFTNGDTCFQELNHANIKTNGSKKTSNKVLICCIMRYHKVPWMIKLSKKSKTNRNNCQHVSTKSITSSMKSTHPSTSTLLFKSAFMIHLVEIQFQMMFRVRISNSDGVSLREELYQAGMKL